MSQLYDVVVSGGSSTGLPKDPPIYVICCSDNRSVTVNETLVELGLLGVRKAKGGLLAWQYAGFEFQR